MRFAERVRRGLVWNQLGRAVELGSGYAASVVAARAFGVVTFGTWSLALSILGLAALAGSLGLNETLNAQVPRLQGSPGRVSWLLRHLLRLRAGIALVLAGALFFAAPAIALAWRHPALAPVLETAAIYAFFTQVSQLLEYFLIGRLEVPRVSRVRAAVQLLHLAAAGAALRWHFLPRQLFLAMAVNAALGVVALLWSVRAALATPPERFDLKPLLGFGAALWATSLVNFFVGRQSDVLIIGLFHPGTEQAGIYSAAATLAMLLAGALLIGAEGVGLAAFSEVASRVDRAGLGRLWSLHVKMDVLLSVPALVFGAVFARELVTTLYGPGFAGAERLLVAYAAVWVAARTLGGGTNLAALYAMNEARVPLAIFAAAGALNLVGDLILVPRLAAAGAVIATGCATLSAGLATGLLVRRRTGATFPVRFAVQVLVVALAAAGFAALLPRPRGLAGLALAAVLVAAATLGGLMLLRPLESEDRRLLLRLAPRLDWLLARI